jgi:hypothetical protein
MMYGYRKQNFWPKRTAENSPWIRWWWPGSAVDKKNITRLMEEYHRKGIGGVEVTSIYGIKGQEKRNIKYLSPEWLDMFKHTVFEARRLGMEVDTPPGSGWRIGGKFITDSVAAAKICIEKSGNGYTVKIIPSDEKVKRAGKGGKGKTFNPFSRVSLKHVPDFYTPFFKGLGIRAQFHDSWEYESDVCKEFFDYFLRARGYDLKKHIDELTGDCDKKLHARVKYDYQITLSEMALNNFIIPWVRWCHKLGQLARNQAHGSPGNLLDLYAAADIPETEVFKNITSDTALLSKFASSASHVEGKILTSSETGTWLKEHFHVTLSDLKLLADNLFVSGINHLVYSGTAYSPSDARWPGWLFYASTQFNPQNTIWRDSKKLNRYVSRCQSILQKGKIDNDLLVYFPVHDIFHDPERRLGERLTIDGRWFSQTDAFRTYRYLWEKGYGFDYISDKQIAESKIFNRTIFTKGGRYKSLIIPPCRFLPVETLENITRLLRLGGNVIFISPAPVDVPGLSLLKNRRTRFSNLMKNIRTCENLSSALSDLKIRRESLADTTNLLFIRRRYRDWHYYFIANQGTRTVDKWIPLAVPCKSALIMDPMSTMTGSAQIRGANPCKIRIQIEPGGSLILRTSNKKNKQVKDWVYLKQDICSYTLKGLWNVSFIEGGPELPGPYKTNILSSWTERGEVEERFAGTAIYHLMFDKPVSGDNWLIDLGKVYSSARIRLNGKKMATLIGPTFRTKLKGVKRKNNILEIEVTNLAANRIRYMDRQKIRWKIFEDINFVNINYKPFDASTWKILPSGLIGPVRLIKL